MGVQVKGFQVTGDNRKKRVLFNEEGEPFGGGMERIRCTMGVLPEGVHPSDNPDPRVCGKVEKKVYKRLSETGRVGIYSREQATKEEYKMAKNIARRQGVQLRQVDY